MTERDDITLLREFAATESEAAFAALVERHVNLVYSSALRNVGGTHAAQEITQAVFIILARKAKSLGAKTILAGWLHQTTRLTAANFLRGEIRRQKREQEAYMQSTLNESAPEVWPQIAPLLDDALGRLGERDRNAIVLRFFENKNLREVGATLGASEHAAKMRVNRALEKLRKIFTKRGVTFSAAAIAAAVSANSVQAAPVGLAKTISAVAIAKGAAVGGATLTLVKGALKIMAWTKAKMVIVVGVAVLAAGTVSTVMVKKAITRANSILEQRLDDGSLLILNRVSFGDKHAFGPGGKKKSWSEPGREELIVEFSLVSKDAANHLLVKPAFYRQFRCVLRGEQGIEYAEEFMRGNFHEDSGGYYGYVLTSIVPRDSHWLWFRIEKSETNNPYGPWQTVAEFKTANPAHSANLKWLASAAPVTNSIDGMDFVLGQITVETKPSSPRDIWNHVVTMPTEVWNHGVLLTNWSPTYVQAEDASGNESYFPSPHSLDPRFVWKLDMDFEPAFNFQDENLATVFLSMAPPASIITNVMGVPVTVSWDGNYLKGSIPDSRPDLALKYIVTKDETGKKVDDWWGGSWGRYQFQRNMPPFQQQIHPLAGKLLSVTIAVVPNVHTIFYAQPELVVEKSN